MNLLLALPDTLRVLCALALAGALTLLGYLMFRRHPGTGRALLCAWFASLPLLALVLALLPAGWLAILPADSGSANPASRPAMGMALLVLLLPVSGVLVLFRRGLALWHLRRRTLALPRVPARVLAVAERLHGQFPALAQADLRLATDSQPGCLPLRPPVVVLPEISADWPDRTLAAVLAHEATHLERSDSRWLTLAWLVTGGLWFMPWLAWARRRLLEDMEQACDALVCARLGDLDGYVQALLQVGRDCGQAPRTQTLLGFASGALTRRVQLLLQQQPRFPGPQHSADDPGGVFWSVALPALAAVAWLSLGASVLQPRQELAWLRLAEQPGATLVLPNPLSGYPPAYARPARGLPDKPPPPDAEPALPDRATGPPL